jgi:ribosome-associated translation inhibitor RaiA
METPVQITFRHMQASPALEAEIRRRAAGLERRTGGMTECRVTVEAPAAHHRKGGHFHVRVDLHHARGALITSGTRDEAHAHEDPYDAVRDAFLALKRRLREGVHGHGRASGRGVAALRRVA